VGGRRDRSHAWESPGDGRSTSQFGGSTVPGRVHSRESPPSVRRAGVVRNLGGFSSRCLRRSLGFRRWNWRFRSHGCRFISDPVVEAYCRWSAHCVGATPDALLDCEHLETAIILESQLADSLNQGRLVLNSQLAGECLDAFGQSGCSASRGLPSVCALALTGTQAPGGICTTEFDCAGGACLAPSGPCPGTCGASGGSCMGASECNPWKTCVNNLCVEGGLQAHPCELDSDCAIGLACIDAGCAQLGTAGQGCQRDEQCASGFFCDLAAIIATCTKQRTVGGVCGGVVQSGLACMEGTYCSTLGSDEVGQCVAVGATGDSCPATPALPTCMIGLACLDGGCGPLPTSGACLNGPTPPCALGYYCDGSGRCQALRADGAPCDDGPVVSGGCASAQCGDAGTCLGLSDCP
jgi:hypothetical protein